jgi:predicted nucleic acid-binding protein
MAALIDTNVLVYLHDHRFPQKQATAHDLIERLLRSDELRVATSADTGTFELSTPLMPLAGTGSS